MRWLFWVTPAADGPTNMAVDEALMRRAGRTREAVFRVYAWSTPTLSIGRNQRARDCYDLAAAAAAGVTFVRRPTGGRALLHHHEITYSATLPLDTSGEARRAYEFINAVLIGALRQLGVPAALADTSPPVPPGLRPCFDVPSSHEIVVGPRKLVGSAQWRHAGALLQHGSILVRDDQYLINRLLRVPEPGAPPAAATLEACLERVPAPNEMAEALRPTLADAAGAAVPELHPEKALELEAAELRHLYHDDAWTWRR